MVTGVVKRRTPRATKAVSSKANTGKSAIRKKKTARTAETKRRSNSGNSRRSAENVERANWENKMLESQTVALADAQRVRALLNAEIAFIDHPGFRDPGAESAATVLAELAAAPTRTADSSGMPEKLPAHLRRLCETPLLTADDERTLFRRMNFLKYRANVLRCRLNEQTATVEDVDSIERLLAGAHELRNRIVQANLRLVMSIVKHYISDQMAFDDLLSEGTAALLRAAEKFDFGRGFRFSTYVTKVVRREVFRLVMAQKRQSDRFTTGNLDYLGEQAEEVTSDVEYDVDLTALKGDLAGFFTRLDPREQLVLRERFGFNCDGKSPSLNDLGRRLGVSKERVRQLELRAIRKLRKAFAQR